MRKIKLFLFQLFKSRKDIRVKKKRYPRDYSIKELEKEIDEYGDFSPNSHLGSSYYARASLGLTELERRSSSFLGWSTFFISFLALIFSIRALNYTAEQTQLTEIQSRSDRIMQLQSITRALENCKNNPVLEESGLYDSSNGKPATCHQIIQQYDVASTTTIFGKIKKLFTN